MRVVQQPQRLGLQVMNDVLLYIIMYRTKHLSLTGEFPYRPTTLALRLLIATWYSVKHKQLM